MKPTPRDFFTQDFIEARTAPPPVLFHFTQYDRALSILKSGQLRGRPTISLTENPALHYTPGPIAIVLDTERILSLGLRLWAFVWNNEWREAEWVVGSADSVLRGREYVQSSQVVIPSRLFRLIGYPPSWTREHPEKIAALAAFEIPVAEFSWEDWWK